MNYQGNISAQYPTYAGSFPTTGMAEPVRESLSGTVKSELSRAIERVQGLTQLTRRIADDALGPMPEAKSGDPNTPSPLVGWTGELQRGQALLHSMIDELNAQLTRLECL